MDSSVQNDLFSTVIEFLHGSFFGNVILVLVVLCIVLAPVARFALKEIKEYKADKEKKEKEEEKRRKEDLEKQMAEYAKEEEFRNNVKKNLQNIDSLTKEMSFIEDELENIKKIRNELSDDLHKSMTELNERMDADKMQSNQQDEIIKESVTHIGSDVSDINQRISGIVETTNQVEKNLGILFEGENNEFRVYITQIHEKYVGTDTPLPRDLKQQLRIKYDMYKKRGGNGWAEDMYNEIINSDIESTKK